MSRHFKLVVFVPKEYGDKLRDAVGKAGGGRMGNYSFCSFSVLGVGRFLPLEGAKPMIGKIGSLESVEEERIEVLVEDSKVKAVISAIKKVHPYEEVAYDLYPLADGR